MNKIKALRAKRRMSQREVAVATGLDQTYISALERSDTLPRLDTLADLARALRCSIDDLIPNHIHKRARSTE